MSSKNEIPANNQNVRKVNKKDYENLKTLFFAKVKTAIRSKRKVLTMAGIPGSGKTTFIKENIANGRFPAGCFILSPDDVMESIPGYKADFEKYGAKVAFEIWEHPARKAAYKLLNEAITLHANIIIDMGAASGEMYDLIYRLKYDHHYKIIMYWLNVPVDIALTRIKKRKRYISKKEVVKRLQVLKKIKKSYIKVVDQFNEVENAE